MVKVTPQGQMSQTWRCLRSLNASCLTFYIIPSSKLYLSVCVCVCVCVCVYVCVCVCVCVWKELSPVHSELIFSSMVQDMNIVWFNSRYKDLNLLYINFTSFLCISINQLYKNKLYTNDTQYFEHYVTTCLIPNELNSKYSIWSFISPNRYCGCLNIVKRLISILGNVADRKI